MFRLTVEQIGVGRDKTKAEKTEKATDLRVQDRKEQTRGKKLKISTAVGCRVLPRSGVQMLDNMT